MVKKWFSTQFYLDSSDQPRWWDIVGKFNRIKHEIFRGRDGSDHQTSDIFFLFCRVRFLSWSMSLLQQRSNKYFFQILVKLLTIMKTKIRIENLKKFQSPKKEYRRKALVRNKTTRTRKIEMFVLEQELLFYTGRHYLLSSVLFWHCENNAG